MFALTRNLIIVHGGMVTYSPALFHNRRRIDLNENGIYSKALYGVFIPAHFEAIACINTVGEDNRRDVYSRMGFNLGVVITQMGCAVVELNSSDHCSIITRPLSLDGVESPIAVSASVELTQSFTAAYQWLKLKRKRVSIPAIFNVMESQLGKGFFDKYVTKKQTTLLKYLTKRQKAEGAK